MGKFEKKNRPTQAQNYAASKPAQNGGSKKAKKKKSRIGLTVGILIGVLVLVIGCVAAYLLLFRDDGKIVNNLYVAGVDLGGMTKEEARSALEEGVKVYGQENMNVALYTQDYSLFTSTYDPEDIPLVDIFGKPLDTSAQTEASEGSGASEEPTEPATEAPTEEPTAPTDPDAPLDENGTPMQRLEQICLTPSDTSVRLDIDRAVEAAYAYGRGGSVFSRVKKNLLSERTDLDVSEFLTVDEDYIRTVLEEYAADSGATRAEASVTEGTTTVSGEEGEDSRELTTLTITLGAVGRTVDVDALYDQILTAYADANFDVKYVMEEDFPEPFDLDALYLKYYKAPVNAVCDEDTYEVTDGADGYGFDIEAAIEALEAAGPGGTVTLTLDVIEPQYTREILESKLFCDELASYDSPHVYNPGRTRNLELACQTINGYVLKPGETFSFNGVVGERTSAKGYQMGGVYVGGETVQQLGGGVCQVASVLYYCTLKSDLEVVERQEHQYVPDYIPWGMDATIYWGSLDYKFRNNTTYPIRIEASVSGGYVHVRFLGTDTKDYTVKLDYTARLTRASETEEIEISPDMKNYEKYKDYTDGQQIQVGYSAYEVDTYRYKYDKTTGELISTEKVNHSSYDWRNRQVAKLVDSTEPTEEPTEPSENPTDPPDPSVEPTDPSEEPTEPPSEDPSEASGDEEAP